MDEVDNRPVSVDVASPNPLSVRTVTEINRLVGHYADELVAFRRDLHAHPEVGRQEIRTTRQVAERLAAAGLESVVLPTGTGLLCDLGDGGDDLARVAIRADLDALRMADEKDVAYRSTHAGVCHACGHDVHTSIVLGAGLVLADLARAGLLEHGVRLIFQPAEEQLPGGALDVMAAGGLDGVGQIFGLHCDPRLEVGKVGLRPGPITSATDIVHIRFSGPGGHTARPHLSADLVHALSTLASQLPIALARHIDSRAGLVMAWGRIHAGSAANVIPMEGELEGTIRCLDVDAWETCGELVPRLAREMAAPFGVQVDTEVRRGVPPVVNDPASTELLHRAVVATLGPEAATTTPQSLGGEDFAWYLTKVAGSFARLGVRPVGSDPYDIHQGGFDVDERCIADGVRFLVAAALLGGEEDRLP